MPPMRSPERSNPVTVRARDPPPEVSGPPGSPRESSLQLFREEVIADRRTQWLGPVLLVPRRSYRLFAIGAVLAMTAILGLLIFGEFTRKTRVTGWVMPQQGLVRVFAPQPGVVAGLHVAEGSHVGRGERLLTLSSELESARLGATQAEVIRRLSELRLALLEERRQAERLLAQQQRTYAERLEALREELRQVERDIGVMEARVALADRNIEVNRGLRKQGFISEQ